MRKVITLSALGIIALAVTSCGGGGHSCDAYRKADYTNHKAKKDIKTKVISTFNKK
jgi:hypothetical protein